MSKNIIIQEGGVARSFSGVHKLETAQQGGSNITWIPEDELGHLEVTENGTYEAEDNNVYGYWKVEVDVPLTTKSITKNGTYKASKDGAKGYTEVVVNVPNTSAFGTDTSGNDYSVTGDGVGGTTLSTDDGDYDVSVDTSGETPEVTLTNIPKGIRISIVGDGYVDGDTLDLDDFATYAIWSNDNEAQIPNSSSALTYSLPDGYKLSKGTVTLRASWRYAVSAGKTRNYTASVQFTVAENPNTLKRIIFGQTPAGLKDGDKLKYSDIKVYAVWSEDGNNWTDVTSECNFTIADQTVLYHENSPYTLGASYTYQNQNPKTCYAQIYVAEKPQAYTDIDGNDYIVNEQGTKVKVPSGISVVTPPTKTTYETGEQMDYTGMVVKMVDGNGQTFTDAQHPNGHLSIGELILPDVAPAILPYSSATGDASGNMASPFSFAEGTFTVNNSVGGFLTASCSGVKFILTCSASGNNYNVRYTACSTEPFQVGFTYKYSESSDVSSSQGILIDSPTTVNGKVLYYAQGTVGIGNITEAPSIAQLNYEYANKFDCYAVLYGEVVNAGADVPVKWESGYTSEMLETSFRITGTANFSGGGHSF